MNKSRASIDTWQPISANVRMYSVSDRDELEMGGRLLAPTMEVEQGLVSALVGLAQWAW